MEEYALQFLPCLLKQKNFIDALVTLEYGVLHGKK